MLSPNPAAVRAGPSCLGSATRVNRSLGPWNHRWGASATQEPLPWRLIPQSCSRVVGRGARRKGSATGPLVGLVVLSGTWVSVGSSNRLRATLRTRLVPLVCATSDCSTPGSGRRLCRSSNKGRQLRAGFGRVDRRRNPRQQSAQGALTRRRAVPWVRAEWLVGILGLLAWG